MNRRMLVGGIMIVLALELVTGQVLSQDKGGEGQPSGEDMAGMIKKWKAVCSPGKGHKRLEHFVGEWKTSMKMWMGGPGTPPVETTGHATVTSVLDGRFNQEVFESDMMMPDETGGM